MMEEILSKNCRICLVELENNNDLVIIDTFKIRQFQFIKVELNLPLTDHPVICSSCANKLEQSFDFKTMLLNNFSYLHSFKSEENPLINIEEFLARPTFSEGIKLEVEKICSFCLIYSQIENLTALDELKEDWRHQKQDLFEKCIPEVDLALVNDPFLCTSCIDSLQNLFNFVLSYIDSEDLFKSYIHPDNVDLKKLDLRHVDQINKNEDSEIKYGTDYLDIKEEIEALSPCPEVKIEDDDHTEDRELLSTDCSHKSSSMKKYSKGTKKSHPCPYCPYKNHKRANLASHLLVHENVSNEPTFKFKCDLCCFSSKWRSSLVTHKLLHKKSPELDIFKCYNCSYETIYKKHLRRHMKLHQFKMYFCKACPYKTKIPTRLKIHKCKPEKVKLVKTPSEESNIKLDSIETRSEDGNQTKTQEYQPDKIYSYFSKIIELDNWYYLCNTCKYKTMKMSGIKDHVLKHQKKRKEKCSQCDYKFKHKKSLKTHIKNVHS